MEGDSTGARSCGPGVTWNPTSSKSGPWRHSTNTSGSSLKRDARRRVRQGRRWRTTLVAATRSCAHPRPGDRSRLTGGLRPRRGKRVSEARRAGRRCPLISLVSSAAESNRPATAEVDCQTTSGSRVEVLENAVAGAVRGTCDRRGRGGFRHWQFVRGSSSSFVLANVVAAP
jgi:hypothetical protein